MRNTVDQILALARQTTILRPRDLDPLGIPRHQLHRLSQRGLLTQIDRGLYRAPDSPPGPHDHLAAVSKRIPHAIVCLVSALYFHGLINQAPNQCWITIPEKARRPQTGTLPLQIVRFSGQALTSGITQHTIAGVTVQIYSPTKTVVDCFKCRNKIGLPLAITALRTLLHPTHPPVALATILTDLLSHAQACRMTNVMQPYLAALAPSSFDHT